MDHLLFEVWNSKVRYTCQKSNIVVWSFIFLWWQLLFIFWYFFVKLTFYLPAGNCVSIPLAFLASLFSRVKFTFETRKSFFYSFDNSVVVLFFYSLYTTVNTRLKNIYLSFTSIFQPFDSGMVPGNFKSGCKLFLGQYSFQSCQLVRLVTIYIITLKSWIVLSPWEADRDPRGTPDPVNTGGSLGRTDLELVTLSFNMSPMTYIWGFEITLSQSNMICLSFVIFLTYGLYDIQSSCLKSCNHIFKNIANL